MVKLTDGPCYSQRSGEVLTGGPFYECSLCHWAIPARVEYAEAAQDHWTEHFAHYLGERIDPWLEVE